MLLFRCGRFDLDLDQFLISVCIIAREGKAKKREETKLAREQHGASIVNSGNDSGSDGHGRRW